MKKENLITVELDDAIVFDQRYIKKISFDLCHINYGWNSFLRDYNSFQRSHYKVEDVVDFFEQFGYYRIEWDDGKNGNKMLITIDGQKYHRYVAFITDHNDFKQKKMVIDIPVQNFHQAVIVTIY